MDEIMKKKITKKFTQKFHQCEQNHDQCENRFRKKIILI
jgi:hypothetical protein